MPGDHRKSTIVFVLLFVAAVAVTFGVMFLCVPREEQTGKFWLVLFSLLFAEACTLAYQVSITLAGTARNTSFPFHFGTGVMVLFYDLGVLALAFVAITGITFGYLAAIHLVWLLLLVTGAGLALLSGSYTKKVSQEERSERAFMVGFKMQMADLLSRLRSIDLPDVTAIQDALRAAEEDLRYAAAESPPGTEAADQELAKCLADIALQVQRMETVRQGSPPQEEAQGGIAEILKETLPKVNKLRALLSRREAVVGQVR